MRNFEQRISNKELADLRAVALRYSNNCGGCEVCSREFGDGLLRLYPDDVFVIVDELQRRRRHWWRVAFDFLTAGQWRRQ